MSVRDREEPARRKETENAPEREGERQSEVTPPASRSGMIRAALKPAARLWALPTADKSIWPVWEIPRLEAIAESLEASPPQILAAEKGANGEQILAEAAAVTERSLRSRGHEAAFAFLQRMVICGALLIAGFFAWRLPGALKFLDTIFIGGSIGYFLYVIGRYGFDALRWHNRRVDAVHSFGRGTVNASPLCERLAKAIRLRANAKEEERGKSPDDELLDTNAYRKLIEEGITTPEELSRLGHALDEQLGLRDPERKERKLSEVAQELGIDVNTALFYADLANAASEIRIEYHVKEAFGG